MLNSDTTTALANFALAKYALIPRDAPFPPLKVLHVLDHSLPILDGYSIRSHGLCHGEHANGHTLSVVTSPLHQIGGGDNEESENDGTFYYRTPLDMDFSSRSIRGGWIGLRELAVIRKLRNRILEVLDAGHYDLIHAHSPVLCGLAALSAAKARRLPLVYEIRAFWEDAAVDQKKTTKHSPRYLLTRYLEQWVVEQADAVVGIASSILDDLRARGIEEQKLFHVPNGVDVDRFRPIQADAALRRELALGELPVLGFIGSLYYFEGLSWLVKAAAELHRQGTRFKLIIIGQGEDSAAIRREIAENQAQDYVHYLGKIAHQEVQRYYSVIDVMVYPRRSIRLTELVTPLKPLEAMAQQKAVLGSSVGGMRELVESEITGLLFQPENIADFCRQARRILQNRALRDTLAQQGRDFVLCEKDWRQVAKRYHKVYASALGQSA